MATLKDVGAAQAEAAEKNQSSLQEEIFVPNYSTGKPDESVVAQQFVIFKMRNKRRGRHYVDGINSAVHPKTGKRQRIYLLRGADSIWQTELTETLKDKEYVAKNRISLLFEDGVLRVPIHDERMLEFARANNNNMGVEGRVANGKHDFYEYDPQKEQQARHEKQLKKINMVIAAKEMPVDKMKKLAMYFAIPLVDDLGMPKSDDGLRTDLMMKADSDPLNFEKYIDSPQVEISYLVKKAIIEAKIDLTGQQGNAIWAGGKGFIARIPVGRKPYEYLTELAMTNSDEGRKFKEQLQTTVK